MSEVEWWEFESDAELAEQVAGDIGFVIESAIEAHGAARLALPGAALPAPVYAALLREAADWSKVVVVPTDERLVAASDPASHGGTLAKQLGAKGAQVISLVDDGALDDYRAAGRIADERLQALDWPLDLACLAITEDGEAGSLLPGPDLDRAIAGPRGRRAVGLHPDPMPTSAAFDRVTLTGDALASARTVMLIVRGRQARETVERAIEEGPLASHPIGRLLTELDADVDIFWSAG